MNVRNRAMFAFYAARHAPLTEKTIVTRIALLSVVLAGLTACGPTLPDLEVEPIRKVLSDNSALPYECVNYDLRSDSCEGLVTRRVKGDRIYYEALALVPGPSDPINMRLKVDFKIEDTRYCGHMRDADLAFDGTLTPGQRSLLQELLLAQLISYGDVCGAYFREGEGYISVTTDRNGRLMPQGVETSHFFARPKPLRL